MQFIRPAAVPIACLPFLLSACEIFDERGGEYRAVGDDAEQARRWEDLGSSEGVVVHPAMHVDGLVLRQGTFDGVEFLVVQDGRLVTVSTTWMGRRPTEAELEQAARCWDAVARRLGLELVATEIHGRNEAASR